MGPDLQGKGGKGGAAPPAGRGSERKSEKDRLRRTTFRRPWWELPAGRARLRHPRTPAQSGHGGGAPQVKAARASWWSLDSKKSTTPGVLFLLSRRLHLGGRRHQG